MPIFNFGSINIDNFYYLPHLPQPGETLNSDRYARQLGGKGANQSVAACRAGSVVTHVGAVGADGDWCLKALTDEGIGTQHVISLGGPTGHANIYVDRSAENSIVLVPGANRAMTWDAVRMGFTKAGPDDTLLLQNETSHVQKAAELGRAKGMRVVYSAAPFEAAAVEAVLPFCDIFVLNEVEAEQLSQALGVTIAEIDVPVVVITRGANGAVWRDQLNGQEINAPAFQVDPVDTTGAGDCFIGNLAAALDQGYDVKTSLRKASAASAIQVTREGTADVMPRADEVEAFLSERL
ncbi:ribokinase [Aliiroseovarius sp. M344]|uniref:ribokinase n=1 Tax=Aliiroseovarius sp. M344 TaxID=2867010 RepID=UPI0021AD8177|nr:ribokinase [Aliiroseovarius sp. M344]UWQ14362.1 ribokinase [Aliiroseovarius sp. M344]